jgi:dephospho-CoA kinase
MSAMRALRIGLTGPIGCGKSTVAGFLREIGLEVVDADVVAREVVEPGTPGLEEVIEAFGDSYRRADGSLDRAALGRHVFADPAELRRLEAIVHPRVRVRVLDLILTADRDFAPGVVVEAIKLVEGGLATLCDEVWLVVCSPEVQRIRLEGRGLDGPTIDQRVAAQGDVATRLRGAASRVLDTSGSLEDVRARVRAAWLDLVREAVERAIGPDL